MKIRKATKKDMKEVGDLIKIEFNKPPYNDGWTDKSVKIMLERLYKIGYGFVAVDRKNIVGIIIVRDDPYAKGLYVVVEQLVVKKEMQGSGIGRALVEEVEKVARKKHAHTIYLYTHKDSKAVKFYKKLGYKQGSVVSMGKKLR